MTDPATTVRAKLGVILAAELERLKLSVSELARRAKLPQQTVHEYIAGNSEPSLSRAMALERAMNRKPGWLSRELA